MSTNVSATSAAATPDASQILVMWDDIFVPDDNYRGNILASKIAELAADFKERGQLEAIGILPSNAAVTDKPWTLDRGFCRHRAMKEAGLHKKTPMKAVIQTPDEPGKPWLRHVRNHASNARHTPPTVFANAYLADALINGTYGTLGGEPAVALSKDQVIKELGYDRTYVNKLLRLVKDLDPDVRVKAEKADAPARLMFMLSKLDGSDTYDKKKATTEEKTAARHDAQMVILDRWIAQQEALESEGRQRSVRGSNGATGAEGGEDEGGEDEGGEGGKGGKSEGGKKSSKQPLIAFSKKLDKYSFTAEDYLRAIEARREAAVADADKAKSEKAKREAELEAARRAGQMEIFNFLCGDKVKQPKALDLTVADFAEEEAEEEETADEGGEA